MAADPAEFLARKLAIERSAKIATILTSKGEDVLLAVLTKARNSAADALIALTLIPPDKASEIGILQNKFQVFTDLVESLQQIVAEGIEADQIDEDVRDEIADIVLTDEDRLATGLSEDNRQ